MNKSIGNVIGDLIVVLLEKDVLTLEDIRLIVGEDNYNKMFEEVLKNDSKQSSAQSSSKVR